MQIPVINILRFFFVFLVLYVHNQIAADNYPLITFIANLGVPGFFLISGYLFFVNVEDFTIEQYWNKLKSRTKTLFIPYLFWNSFAAFFVLASMLKNGVEQIDILNLWEHFNPYTILWNFEHTGVPAHLVTWFIRDLFLMVLVSPVFYWVVRFFPSPVYLLFLLLLIGTIPLFHFSFSRSIAYFGIGAYLGLERKKWYKQESFTRFGIPCIALLLLFSLCPKQDGEYYQCFKAIAELCGVLLCLILASFASSKNMRIPQLLVSSSFFIYLVHIFQPAHHCTIHALSYWFVSKSIGQIPQVGMLLTCLTFPVLTVFICLLLYYLLRRYYPSSLVLLTGGR